MIYPEPPCLGWHRLFRGLTLSRLKKIGLHHLLRRQCPVWDNVNTVAWGLQGTLIRSLEKWQAGFPRLVDRSVVYQDYLYQPKLLLAKRTIWRVRIVCCWTVPKAGEKLEIWNLNKGREPSLTKEVGVISPKSLFVVTSIQNRDYFLEKWKKWACWLGENYTKWWRKICSLNSFLDRGGIWKWDRETGNSYLQVC